MVNGLPLIRSIAPPHFAITPAAMKHLARPALFLLLSVLAVGCVSTSERTAQRNNERCINRGHQPGSERFNECLLLVESERTQRIDDRRREMMESRPVIPGRN